MTNMNKPPAKLPNALIDYDALLTLEQAEVIRVAAGNVFRPRAPINTQTLFAGRWEQMKTIADAVAQPGLHVVIYGERGVGKSSLANVLAPVLSVLDEKVGRKDRLVAKVNANQGDSFHTVWNRIFHEVSWQENKPTMGFIPQPGHKRVTLSDAFSISDKPSIDDVRRVLTAITGSVFIFDEFDRGSDQLRADFTDLIKALSDYAVDSTVIIVGVASTIDGLVRDHASIGRSIIQINLPRMSDQELAEIISKASHELGVIFDDAASWLIVKTSQGLPNYTHLIGLHAVRLAATNDFTRRITLAHVHKSFETSVKQALQTIQETYLKATRSSHKDALYTSVILACAIASSSAGHPHGEFYPSDVVEPLSMILNRDNVSIATCQGHLAEFCEPKRGPVLIKEGSPRSYRYRFAEPLLPPFIYMTALKDGILTADQLNDMTKLKTLGLI